jgi:hypothetical protein
LAQRKLRNSLTLLLVSSALALLSLEFGFRAYIFGTNAFSVLMMNSVQALGESGLVTRSSCPELVWELHPDLGTHFKLVRFETNSHGLRDREYSQKPSPNTTRVAVVGDSYTMASGVQIGDSYHALLEERFNRSDPDHLHEFINFGTGGYFLRQYVADLHCRVLDFDPDLVLIGFVPKNDHRIPPEEAFHEPYLVRPATTPFYSSFAFEEIAEETEKAWERMTGERAAPGVEPTEQQIEYMEEMFAQLGELSREHDLPILVVYLTYRTDRDVRPELIRRLAEDNGLGFHDVSGAFEGTDPKKFRIFLTDGHPDEVAHRTFADELYEDLRDKLSELRAGEARISQQ